MPTPRSHPCAHPRSTVLALLLVLFTAIFTPPASATEPADEVKLIETQFDTLAESVKSIKTQVDSITANLKKCGDYLDTLGTSPQQIAGKDVNTAFTAALDLDYQTWTNGLTANQPTITDLLLKDTVVRGAMLDIKKQIVAINEEFNKIKPQAELIRSQSETLGKRLKDYVGKKPLRAIQFTSLTMKVGGLGKDMVATGTAAQKGVLETGQLLRQITVLGGLLPPTDPLVGELAGVQVSSQIASTDFANPGATTGTFGTANPMVPIVAGLVADQNPEVAQALQLAGFMSGAGGAPSTPAATPAPATTPSSNNTFAAAPIAPPSATAASPTANTGLFGFWQGNLLNVDGTGVAAAHILLGAPRAGRGSGYLVLPAAGVQATLTLREASDTRMVFIEEGTGLTLHLTARPGTPVSLIAERFLADGTQLQQGFLKHP